MRTHTHALPFFTRRDAQGREQAVCGTYITARELAPLDRIPTCWGCAVWVREVEQPTREMEQAS